MSKIDTQQQLDIQIAIVCDLNLGYYLVPKKWVKEIINRTILQTAVTFLTGDQYSNKEIETKLEVAQKALNLSQKLLVNDATDDNEQINKIKKQM